MITARTRDLETARQVLMMARAARVEQVQAIVPEVSDVELDEDGIAVTTQARDQALVEVFEKDLSQIESALHRVEEGTYGVCDRCGDQIPPRRMEVLPFATLCTPCQRIEDRVRTAGR